MNTRRNFLKQSATFGTGLALANSSLAAKEKTTGPKLEGRIFKALKGGQKGGETPEAFFERLKSLGFDGVGGLGARHLRAQPRANGLGEGGGRSRPPSAARQHTHTGVRYNYEHIRAA